LKPEIPYTLSLQLRKPIFWATKTHNCHRKSGNSASKITDSDSFLEIMDSDRARIGFQYILRYSYILIHIFSISKIHSMDISPSQL
jgi:hypothetical protein